MTIFTYKNDLPENIEFGKEVAVDKDMGLSFGEPVMFSTACR